MAKALTERQVQKVFNSLFNEYFNLKRFSESNNIALRQVVYSRDFVFGEIENLDGFEYDSNYSEKEIADYLKYKEIPIFNDSILYASKNKKYIIEELDIYFNDIDIVDPAEYIAQFLEVKQTTNITHFRLIPSRDFENYTQIKREELYLNNTIPPSSSSSSQPVIKKF